MGPPGGPKNGSVFLINFLKSTSYILEPMRCLADLYGSRLDSRALQQLAHPKILQWVMRIGSERARSHIECEYVTFSCNRNGGREWRKGRTIAVFKRRRLLLPEPLGPLNLVVISCRLAAPNPGPNSPCILLKGRTQASEAQKPGLA